MSSRPLRTDEARNSPARQPTQPRTEQLIETHKAWIAAAAGLDTRHARRRPRYFRHLRPLAISTGIVAAALLLVSLTRGGDGESAGRPADLAGELIPTLGADAAANPVARAFRGGKSGSDEARKRGGNRAAQRRATEPPRERQAPAERPREALREERVPEPSLALTSAPAAAPQVTDGRPAAEPGAPGARSGDTQAPRTAAAVPEVQ